MLRNLMSFTHDETLEHPLKCRTNNVSMDFLAEKVTNKEEFEKAVLRNNASLMKKKKHKMEESTQTYHFD